MFQRTINGLALRFHLAGINNQNFLMRDEQTGTYWQQITGLAIAGPLAGHRLALVSADELTFALWKAEAPSGTVLNDAPAFARNYAPPNWDVEMAKTPTTLSYAQPGLQPRTLMLGIAAGGVSRAFRYNDVIRAGFLQDHVGSTPILLAVGSDGRSVRAFRRTLPGAGAAATDFYRLTGTSDAGSFLDASTGTRWNFQGCAVTGKLQGACLPHVNVIKDYWFDWRHYQPGTTVYGVTLKGQ